VKRHAFEKENEQKQAKKKVFDFSFKQIIINGSLDCIANSLRPTMICDHLQNKYLPN
jgi:hypothetical protein